MGSHEVVYEPSAAAFIIRILGDTSEQDVAAEPRRQVFGATQGGEQRGETREHCIAGRVPGAVVDSLQAVEIQAHESQRAAVTPRQRDSSLQGLIEVAPVGEVGEFVGGGEVDDGGVGVGEGRSLRRQLILL